MSLAWTVFGSEGQGRKGQTPKARPAFRVMQGKAGVALSSLNLSLKIHGAVVSIVFWSHWNCLEYWLWMHVILEYVFNWIDAWNKRNMVIVLDLLNAGCLSCFFFVLSHWLFFVGRPGFFSQKTSLPLSILEMSCSIRHEKEYCVCRLEGP